MAIIGRAFPALGRRFLVFWSGKRQWTFEIRSVLHGKYILIFNILNILNIYSMKKKMCELPSPLLPHLQPHEVITKAWLHGHSSVYYSLVSLTAAIAFKSTKKEQMGDRAKPLNTENENTHGCIPQNFASFPSSKGDGMFQCCTYRLVRLLPRFLISSSNPRAVCERNPKNARHSAMRTELCLLLRDWARTSIKLVKPRVRSLIQRPAPSWRRRNERKHAVNCRHFIWLHWPITGLVPGTTLPWTSASSRLARSCPVSKYYRKSVLRSKS